jgi:hypothetical protein
VVDGGEIILIEKWLFAILIASTAGQWRPVAFLKTLIATR